MDSIYFEKRRPTILFRFDALQGPRIAMNPNFCVGLFLVTIDSRHGFQEMETPSTGTTGAVLLVTCHPQRSTV